MDDRTKAMIEWYLPNPPDETLEEEEYYFMQDTAAGERIIRVFAMDVLPMHDGTEYGIYQQRGGVLRRIDAGYGTDMRGVRMSRLYDNKQDCKNSTHYAFDDWPDLRQIQKKEGLI